MSICAASSAAVWMARLSCRALNCRSTRAYQEDDFVWSPKMRLGVQVNAIPHAPGEGRQQITVKPATARVFFALWPSTELADHLGQIACDAAARFGGRATRPDSIHLTLAFLGNVPEACLPELLAAAASVSAEAFILGINRLDFWGHNHLLWAGCTVPPTQLAALVAALREALVAAGFKAGRAGGEFSPHVSLVRRVPEGAVSSSACPMPIGELRWSCSRFVLVRSQLTATGSNYRIIGEFPLSGGSLG